MVILMVILMVIMFRCLLEMGVVSPNISFSRHVPIPILVRVCEDGMYGYVKALLDNGAKVCCCHSYQCPIKMVPCRLTLKVLQTIFHY